MAVMVGVAAGAAPAIGAQASSGLASAIGSALAAPVYVDPYVDAPAPPPPAAYAPVATGYGPTAWSPDWYDYCAQRYRSFNPRTGYFMGYDGQPHFCQ
jgi:BA14K-like protein